MYTYFSGNVADIFPKWSNPGGQGRDFTDVAIEYHSRKYGCSDTAVCHDYLALNIKPNLSCNQTNL